MPGVTAPRVSSVARWTSRIATREFGERVRARRHQLGESQEQLAQESSLHWSYLGQVERGQRNPTLHNILKLAEVLGVDPGELVHGLRSPE